jgi:hypothetical protein
MIQSNVNCQLGNQLDAGGKNSLRTRIKSFFHSTIYNRKWAYLSSKNSTSPQLTSAQWFLFRLWRLENEEMEALLHNLQMRRAFIVALTSEKCWMTKKKFIPQLAIDS